jgi:type III secretory pathway component EscV
MFGKLRGLARDPAAALTQYSDILLAGLIIGILGMMIIPLPYGLLDHPPHDQHHDRRACILLISHLHLGAPEASPPFPTILLVTTLFRLGAQRLLDAV